MKLLWYLGDWWSWSFFFLALLVMPVMAEGTWSALPVIASVALVSSLEPNFQKYQLVGLGSRIWNEHRRILVALLALAAAAGALTVQLWWALPVYAVAAVWAMYRSATPRRSGYTTVGMQPSSGFGWFPRTLAGQAIYRPQVKAWGAACLAQAIGLCLPGIRRKSRCLVSLASSSGHFLLPYSPQPSIACEFPCANTRYSVEAVLFGPGILPCSAWYLS